MTAIAGAFRGGSVVQFQRELNLARRARGPANNAEAAAADDVRGQAEIDFVEDIKKFSAKLKDSEFAVSAMAESGVLDQGHVKIAEARAAECVAAKSAEAAAVGPGSTGDVAGNLEKRAIHFTQPEIVLAHSAAGG